MSGVVVTAAPSLGDQSSTNTTSSSRAFKGTAAAGQSRRDAAAPGPPCGLGLAHGSGSRSLDEGPDLLGDGAPVRGRAELGEQREQSEVDALEDDIGLRDSEVLSDGAAHVEEAVRD